MSLPLPYLPFFILSDIPTKENTFWQKICGLCIDIKQKIRRNIQKPDITPAFILLMASAAAAAISAAACFSLLFIPYHPADYQSNCC